MEYWFYHLEQSSLEATLPTLLEKTLERGWTARLQFNSSERLSEVDAFLWTYRDDSFLPHGRSDAPLSDAQPILLSLDSALQKQLSAVPDLVFLIGGAQPEALDGVTRCITMVDSRDEAGRTIARARWQDAKAAGHPVSYWRQDAYGKWAKQ